MFMLYVTIASFGMFIQHIGLLLMSINVFHVFCLGVFVLKELVIDIRFLFNKDITQL